MAAIPEVIWVPNPTPLHCIECGRLLPYVGAEHLCSSRALIHLKAQRRQYAVREDNGEYAKWLVEFQIRDVNLLQFADIGPGAKVFLFDDAATAARYIKNDPSLSSAIVVQCTIVDDKLVIHT